MSNNSEQNGRQQTGEAAPPTDPRTRNVPQPPPEPVRICRDFVWGICLMKEHCKYRHELDFESMRSILKFCHDYQNRTGCARPDCTYLHTSREEENLFLTTGQIPRVLAERYASMSVPQEPAPEPVPQMMYNMNEYMAQPPPPPPPSSGGPPPTPPQPVAAPVPASMQGQIPGSNMAVPMGSLSGTMTGAVPVSMCNGPMPLSMTGVMTPTMSGPMQPSMSEGMLPSVSGTMPPMSGPMPPSMSAPMHPTISVMPLSGMMPSPMPVPRPMEQASPQAQMQMSLSHGMQATMSASVPAGIPTILAPPPPPPPPTATIASTQMTSPIYAAPMPMQQTMTAMGYINPSPHLPLPSQPHPLGYQVMFDPSRPPPPLPVGAQGRAQKRPMGEPEAGPSKARKSDGSHDSLCENCVQRELRNELYRQEIESLQRDEEYRRLLLEKKTEEYENGRILLRTLLSPEIFRIMDEYIEGNNQPSTSSDLPSTSSPTYNSGLSSIPRNFMFQMMEYLLNTKSAVEPTPPVETRRASPTPDMIASIIELIRNSGLVESRLMDTLNSNGVTRMGNGPMDIASTSGAAAMAPRYPGVVPASSPRYPAPPPQPARQFPPEPPAPQPVAPPASIPPPAYMAYPSPVAPSPSRPFYQPYPGTPHNVAYSSPVAAQSPRASTSAAPSTPVNGQNYAQYMPRLPHQYYPPFQ